MRGLTAAFIVLFCGIALLAEFLLVGEIRQVRLLSEYEADRTASALLEAVRRDGAIREESVDPRVKGFGVYDSSGASTYRRGNAPERLETSAQAVRFEEDAAGRSLLLVRPTGAEFMEMDRRSAPAAERRMQGRQGARAMPPMSMGMMAGRARTEWLYLSLDIASSAWRRRLLSVGLGFAPFLVAGLAAGFLLMYRSAARYRRRAEEREKLARLGETARTLAHEIRNPLGAIRMQTALLRRARPGESVPEVEAIDEEVERLTLLSRRVSEYLKDPKGRPEPVELAAFLEDLARRLPWPVELRLGPAARSAVVRIDPSLLRSVVENLARNARESYPDDAAERPVEMELTTEGRRAVVCVRDRGCGIPEENASKVFDPFFTDKLHGSGIGLAISRSFVEAAGGTISLRSRPGGGTEARFELPAGRTA